jgi:DNA-binding MarR family transcriptional regulator
MRAGHGGRGARPVRAVDYRTLADLRYHIRRFLQVREAAARAAGIEPQQYVVLLHLKAMQGTAAPTIGALAARLLVRHHTAVELVDRLVERGMVRRVRETGDRRAVRIALRPAGSAVLRKLAAHSLVELARDGPALVTALSTLLRPGASRKPGLRRGGG